MAIGIFGNQTIETGLTIKHDRQNRFKIKRTKDDAGAHVYTLENISKGERILINRYLFDRFRATIYYILKEIEREHEVTIDRKIYFKNINHYYIKTDRSDFNKVIIQELKPTRDSTGLLTFDKDSVGTLVRLLYDERLQHPNDVLDRIISYHKLFGFTFDENSESMTSNLILRKDILSQIERYIPGLAVKTEDLKNLQNTDTNENEQDTTPPKRGPSSKSSEKGVFKSRLGQKDKSKSYSVNIETLFSSESVSGDYKLSKNTTSKREGEDDSIKTAFSLPILASEIKSFSKTPFRCELTVDEISALRSKFIDERENDYFIGFEIIDAIFNHRGKLYTFRFPLYYMKIVIRESGRYLYLEPEKDGSLWLNHLALANLIESFGKGSVSQNSVDKFFTTLLSQTIEVKNQIEPIRLKRMLPFHQDIFDKTREVLLGLPGENGKGGILGSLSTIGIECDLESVSLYKASKSNSLTEASLLQDLSKIQRIAYENPDRFYSSLLGGFLTPEMRKNEDTDKFAPNIFIPGALTKSTKKLLNKLDKHDLLLLEGPPGTGKTHTIMNMFIHCLCSGKKLLIVSDQKVALHALIEKLDDYLIGKDRESGNARKLVQLWQTAVKVMDEVPTSTESISKWVSYLNSSLKIDSSKEMDWPEIDPELEKELSLLDKKIEDAKNSIEDTMKTRLGPDADIRKRVTPKVQHATTIDDIESLVEFLRFIEVDNKWGNATKKGHLIRFIKDREYLVHSDYNSCYDFFQIPTTDSESIKKEITSLSNLENFLKKILKERPKSLRELEILTTNKEENSIINLIYGWWEEKFPIHASKIYQQLLRIKSFFSFPLLKKVHLLKKLISNQKEILKSIADEDIRIAIQLQDIHNCLSSININSLSLSLEICRFSIESLEEEPNTKRVSIYESLTAIDRYQIERDEIVRKSYIGRLGQIANGVFASDEAGGTNSITTIAALLDTLKNYKSINNMGAIPVLIELQNKLLDTFPIWLCRKQVVPFLFPCKEHSFDMIIVDEAGQCRVDDALPLLFRGKKLMAVGDDKQTVLAKNSYIDDYLFKEFDLDEHLRTTQARRIKGGGSHLFGLVKSIKQASVLLDEHFRCPPEIIQYSNKFVYNNELKVMQWSKNNQLPSVVVDYSEEHAESNIKPTSGKFKGIETEMIDRFTDYIKKSLKSIEKETGEKINIKTDVAICYFLLKNEPYIKNIKPELLRKISRGDDVLDGAGAALQGKERDYIFYFWDITRSNMMAFRQGDDIDKRKGELNVLMSRPKKRAYHYLHKGFSRLDHPSSSITNYLWQTYLSQTKQKSNRKYKPRKHNPGSDFIPWRRSSGQLINAICEEVFKNIDSSDKIHNNFKPQYSVIIGNPNLQVDLVFTSEKNGGSIGIVDLCGFEFKPNVAEDIVDYYFQLKRASPNLSPVFLFIHELADNSSYPYKDLSNKIRNTKS